MYTVEVKFKAHGSPVNLVKPQQSFKDVLSFIKQAYEWFGEDIFGIEVIKASATAAAGAEKSAKN